MKRYSIVVDDMTRCYVCGTTRDIHIHEIFYGTANRKKSIKHGMCIGLCGKHHNMSGEGVHFNKLLDIELKRKAQRKFEETHTREEFMREFGRNYL